MVYSATAYVAMVLLVIRVLLANNGLDIAEGGIFSANLQSKQFSPAFGNTILVMACNILLLLYLVPDNLILRMKQTIKFVLFHFFLRNKRH